MESGTILFTEISLLEQASLSGGVISIRGDGGAGGSAIAEPGETVVIGSPGSPGEYILGEVSLGGSSLGESSTIFRSGERSKANKKRSKADKKRVKKSRKRIK